MEVRIRAPAGQMLSFRLGFYLYSRSVEPYARAARKLQRHKLSLQGDMLWGTDEYGRLYPGRLLCVEAESGDVYGFELCESGDVCVYRNGALLAECGYVAMVAVCMMVALLVLCSCYPRVSHCLLLADCSMPMPQPPPGVEIRFAAALSGDNLRATLQPFGTGRQPHLTTAEPTDESQ